MKAHQIIFLRLNLNQIFLNYLKLAVSKQIIWRQEIPELKRVEKVEGKR